MFRLSLSLFLLAFVFSCASTTMINSVPSGAKLYIDGSYVGKTPYTYSDTKIVGSATQLKLKKEGCEDWAGILTRSEKFEVGPCIGGVLVLVPFLWIMGYNPAHTYELECQNQSRIGDDRLDLSAESPQMSMCLNIRRSVSASSNI